MRETGESYSQARAHYLAENGLPADTVTSKSGARRREKKIVAEYGAHLGVELEPTTKPQVQVQVKTAGRVR